MQSRRHGFTLLEITIYITVLVILGVPLVSIVLASTRTTTENDTFNRVEERNRTCVFRIERDLRKSMSGTAVVTNGGRTLTFTAAAGFDGTNVIPGAIANFRMQLAQGEVSNGVDDNGNGMVDEGELIRDDNTPASVRIAGDIDLNNSSFALNGTGVTMNIASFGSLKGRGTFSLSKSLTVYPRN